jgi:hypothetical protein
MQFRGMVFMNIRDKVVGPTGPVSKENLANIGSGFETIYKVTDDTPFWDLARRTDQDVKAFDATGAPSLAFNLGTRLYNLIYRRGAREFKLKRPDPTKRRTLVVNHLGVTDLREQYGNLVPEECTMVVRSLHSGPLLEVESIVLQRKLNLSLVAIHVSDAFWDSLRVSFFEELQRAILD